jgi:hypothetical protein
MKKRFLFFIIIIQFYSITSYSQFEYYRPDTTVMKHHKGERSFSVSPNVLIHTPNGIQIAGGFKTRYFVSNRISMDADLVLGRKYLHFGPGIIAVPFLLFQPNAINSGYEFESFGELFFFLGLYMLSFEHVAYHIPLKKFADISPYVSLLRFKSAGNSEFTTSEYPGAANLTFATGVELNKYFGRFALEPYIEYNIGYKDHISGIYLGVYCGFCFP